MRIKFPSPVLNLSNNIRDELCRFLQPVLDVRAISNLADCACCALITRSVNSYEWIPILPRESAEKSKETWIRKVLDSPLIDTSVVMSALISEVVQAISPWKSDSPYA